jgi:hypothetical protein
MILNISVLLLPKGKKLLTDEFEYFLGHNSLEIDKYGEQGKVNSNNIIYPYSIFICPYNGAVPT